MTTDTERPDVLARLDELYARMARDGEPTTRDSATADILFRATMRTQWPALRARLAAAEAVCAAARGVIETATEFDERHPYDWADPIDELPSDVQRDLHRLLDATDGASALANALAAYDATTPTPDGGAG